MQMQKPCTQSGDPTVGYYRGCGSPGLVLFPFKNLTLRSFPIQQRNIRALSGQNPLVIQLAVRRVSEAKWGALVDSSAMTDDTKAIISLLPGWSCDRQRITLPDMIEAGSEKFCATVPGKACHPSCKRDLQKAHHINVLTHVWTMIQNA